MGRKSKREIKLNKTISKQLEPFGITKAELSDEYYYDFADASVGFKPKEDDITDSLFLEFLKDRFNYYCNCPFVLSLLHEVGHHIANDEIEGDILTFCLNEKERIIREEEEETIENFETEEEIIKLSYQYFNLPDEIMATQWAVNYAKEHPQEIEEMQKVCDLALSEFLGGK